ncbi:arrestin domain-containing protein 4-like [Dysidea avara]|uniref:arrestin domain-containing protein 4-like n=1 Tax=Dysidea avara TaxID=196820 RepID=UPI00332EEB33
MVKGKHVDLVLNVNGDRQSYTTGSTVTGSVVLKLSKNLTPMHHISVVFSGDANVSFSINLYGHTRRFTNPTNLCTITQRVWDAHGQRVTSGLSAGVYEFPFGFQIPTNILLPSSFEIKRNNHIQYSLFAGISQSGTFDFAYKSTINIIELTEIVGINTPDLRSPHSITSQMVVSSFFQSPRSIFLSVGIQRKGYCLGESIAINATAENHSSKRIVALRASLTQTVVTAGTARYRPSPLSSMLTVPGKKIRLMVFNQNDYPSTTVVGEFSHWNNVLLPIPSKSLLPTTSSCQVINVSYTLNVTLVLHKKKDISVSIPITIGTVSFRGQLAIPHVQSATNLDTPIIVSQTSYYDCPRKQLFRSGWGGPSFHGGGGGGGCSVGGGGDGDC